MEFVQLISATVIPWQFCTLEDRSSAKGRNNFVTKHCSDIVAINKSAMSFHGQICAHF